MRSLVACLALVALGVSAVPDVHAAGRGGRAGSAPHADAASSSSARRQQHRALMRGRGLSPSQKGELRVLREQPVRRPLVRALRRARLRAAWGVAIAIPSGLVAAAGALGAFIALPSSFLLSAAIAFFVGGGGVAGVNVASDLVTAADVGGARDRLVEHDLAQARQRSLLPEATSAAP